MRKKKPLKNNSEGIVSKVQTYIRKGLESLKREKQKQKKQRKKLLRTKLLSKKLSKWKHISANKKQKLASEQKEASSDDEFYDYENLHLSFDPEKSPKFRL